jgi:hypothetical protein
MVPQNGSNSLSQTVSIAHCGSNATPGETLKKWDWLRAETEKPCGGRGSGGLQPLETGECAEDP